MNEGLEAKGYACYNGHMLVSESGSIESHGEENRNGYVNAYHACGLDHGRTSGSENDASLVLGWENEISERRLLFWKSTLASK